MISAACPSCGSSITFRHAASVSAVCGACDSTVARTDLDVRLIGKITPFVRELSPVQIDATGVHAGRRFRVVGGLRRQRPGVRWNEWYIAFEDGGSGWLSEGNGQFQLFASAAGKLPTLVKPPAVGASLRVGDTKWTVAEVGWARVTAAVGELPYTPSSDEEVPYADLRGPGDTVGTLDWADGEAAVYAGEGVDLPALRMEGLRPFAGFSDPVLVNFAGPEIEGTRALRCPHCDRAIALRAPADSVRLTCAACGSVVKLGELGLPHLVLEGSGAPRTFSIPLGARATFRAVPWELIGVLERYVIEEGERYIWWEYLLHNPYRGFRWLVEDPNHHWSLAELLFTPPEKPNTQSCQHEGEDFLAFNRGKATVSYAIGEFTWEVAQGESVETIDFVAPPRMLSREKSAGEITWSVGTYLSVEEVERAFQKSLPAPTGVGPHQPNPYAEAAALKTAHGAVAAFLIAGSLLLMLTLLAPGGELLAQGTTHLTGEEAPVLTEAFTVPDDLNHTVRVSFRSSEALTLSLIGSSTDHLYETTHWGGTGSVDMNPAPGDYVLSVTRPETGPAAVATVSVELRPRDFWPALLVLGWGLGLLGLLHFLRSSFEQRRWSGSGL